MKKQHGMQILVRYIVKRKDGSIRYDSGKELCHCMVLQFLQVLCPLFKGAVLGGVKDIGGVARTIPGDTAEALSGFGYIEAGSDEIQYGIVVGTGSGAEANDDYKLGSQCGHGSGENEFLYGSMTLTESTIVGSNVDYIMERSFTNGSGSSITIEEVGVYIRVRDTLPAIMYFCIVRDLTGGIAVGHGEVLTVEYTWRTTV